MHSGTRFALAGTVVLVCSFLFSAIALSAPATTLARNLSLGSSGEDVKYLQMFLKETGDFTHPTITSYFGPITEAAVQKFQARMGIVSSGTPQTTGYGSVGPKTRAAINGAVGGGTSAPGTATTPTAPVSNAALIAPPVITEYLSFGITSEQVRQLQRYLRQTGDYTYPDINGFYGIETEKAVQNYQKRKSIVSSGTPSTTGYGAVGPLTAKTIANDTEPLPDDTNTPSVPASSSGTAGGMTLSISASPTTIALRNGATLTWASTGAASCFVTGAGLTDVSGTWGTTSTGPLLGSALYVLTCTDSKGARSQRSAMVTVSNQTIPQQTIAPTAPATSSTGSAPTVKVLAPNGGESYQIGSKATLSWTIANAPLGSVVCSIIARQGYEGVSDFPALNNCIPAVNGNQSLYVTFDRTNSYAFIADSYRFGITLKTSATDTAVLALDYGNQFFALTGESVATNQPTPTTTALPIVSLYATPSQVNSGGLTTLAWYSTNASSCTASGGWSGTKPTEGNELIQNITNAMNFFLSCTGLGGTGSANAGVALSTIPSNPTNPPPSSQGSYYAQGSYTSTPPPSPSSGGSVPTPNLYVEDYDGTKYLRVEEQVFTLSGLTTVASGSKNGGSQSVNGSANNIENVVWQGPGDGFRIGDQSGRPGTTRIYNYRAYDWNPGCACTYGTDIKIGQGGSNPSATATLGPTYIQRMYGDLKEQPDYTYEISNTDVIGTEFGNSDIYIRDFTGLNAGDAPIDTKSQVYLMNTRLSGGIAAFKMWEKTWGQSSGTGNVAIIANTIIEGQVELRSPWAQIRYYNVLWNGHATPQASDFHSAGNYPNGHEYTAQEAVSTPGWVTPISYNELASLSGDVGRFFATNIDRIYIQYSKDNGSWVTVNVPNTGGPNNPAGLQNNPPVGDPIYRLSSIANVNDGNYRFRVWYGKSGATGSARVIDENGGGSSVDNSSAGGTVAGPTYTQGAYYTQGSYVPAYSQGSYSSGGSGFTKPTVYIETDPSQNGDKYLRVEEQKFTPTWSGTPVNGASQSSDRYSVSTLNQETNILNTIAQNLKYGLYLKNTGTTNIYNFTMYNIEEDGGYGGGIALGDNTLCSDNTYCYRLRGPTYIQRYYGDGNDAPDPTYSSRNADILDGEWDNALTYVRDFTAKNPGDAGVDTKSSTYIANATISGGNAALKLWEKYWGETTGTPNKIIIVNSIVNGQVELRLPTSQIEYYNVLWNGHDTLTTADMKDPDGLPNGLDSTYNSASALSWTRKLSSNPLPSLGGDAGRFFATIDPDRIRTEYSTNGGSSWTEYTFPNTGASGSKPIGDPRYKLPSNLTGSNVQWRAWYEKSGAMVGSKSVSVSAN